MAVAAAAMQIPAAHINRANCDEDVTFRLLAMQNEQSYGGRQGEHIVVHV